MLCLSLYYLGSFPPGGVRGVSDIILVLSWGAPLGQMGLGLGGGSNPCPTYDNVNYVLVLKPVYQILQ